MNEATFNRKGDVYAKARPAYPAALFSYLLEQGVLHADCTAADIGSGTGIFTLQLAQLVSKVYAVEPNADMHIKAETAFASCGNIVSVGASAEQTTLADHSVDIVTVAQAFHWFDRAAFRAECRRILKENGTVLLIWNDRDADSPIIRDNFAVNKQFCPRFYGSSNGISFDKASFADFFAASPEVIEFDNSLCYDRDAFVLRNLSSSYAPVQGDTHYDRYVQEIHAVFDKHSKNGTVIYPYITRCYIGTV